MTGSIGVVYTYLSLFFFGLKVLRTVVYVLSCRSLGFLSYFSICM